MHASQWLTPEKASKSCPAASTPAVSMELARLRSEYIGYLTRRMAQDDPCLILFLILWLYPPFPSSYSGQWEVRQRPSPVGCWSKISPSVQLELSGNRLNGDPVNVGLSDIILERDPWVYALPCWSQMGFSSSSAFFLLWLATFYPPDQHSFSCSVRNLGLSMCVLYCTKIWKLFVILSSCWPSTTSQVVAPAV